MKYTAIVSATFQVEFEDNEELDLRDQAHCVASGVIDEAMLLDLEVREVLPVENEVAA